jgi:hypothetical protein
MPEYVGKTRDESCNRNTDIKRGDRRKRDRERDRGKKKKRVKAAETTDIYFSRGKERKKKQRNKRQSIVRHRSVQRSERQ